MHYTKPPVPKAPYPTNEIIDATTNNKGCNQAQIEGSENCLTLNVFTPKVNLFQTLLHVQ
jgi:carboxylesterase type B